MVKKAQQNFQVPVLASTGHHVEPSSARRPHKRSLGPQKTDQKRSGQTPNIALTLAGAEFSADQPAVGPDFQKPTRGSATKGSSAADITGSPSEKQSLVHIAFLRGVNVGGHNRLPMAELRILLSGLGYKNVRTHLQSGNALFDTAAAEQKNNEQIGQDIQDQIEAALGLSVSVLVRTQAEIADVVAGNPFNAEARSDGSKLLVLFLPSMVDQTNAWKGLDEEQYLPERFKVGRREIYLWCPNGVAAAKLGSGFWEKRLGLSGTARNWNTVSKLLEMANS